VGETAQREQSSIIVTQGGSIKFAICSSIFKPSCVKLNWCGKLKPNLALFDLCTIGGWEKCLSEF